MSDVRRKTTTTKLAKQIQLYCILSILPKSIITHSFLVLSMNDNDATTLEVTVGTREAVKNEMKKVDTYDSFLQILVKLAKKFPEEVEKLRAKQ